MSTELVRSAPAVPGFSLTGWLVHEPVYATLGLTMLAAMIPTAFAQLIDTREFLGVGVWDKPLKFEFALAAYLLSLAFFAQFLPAGATSRLWYRIHAAAVAIAIILEILWIGGASMLGTASHFNDTPIGAVIYGFMGIAAIVLTSATTVYAVLIARNPALALSPAVREGLVLGLGLVLPLTLVTAGTLASMDSHWVGVDAGTAIGLPLMGWARNGGDLRVAHFFSTHAMHFVPFLGLVSAYALGRRNVWPVRVFAGLFVLLVLGTFVQALAGQPFLPWL
jgi:hypothetical protein